MLSIGEFAGMTGLSVKALRHYDEKGVLVPRDVDPRSGYRRYGEDQVRAGVVVRALRAADVPLADVAHSVAAGDGRAALEAHQQAVLAERARQDLALAGARQVLAALTAPVEVVERSCAEQPFVGRVLSVPADEVDTLSDDVANDQFAQLFAALQRASLGPSGQFWTTLRAGDQGSVEVVCCWPTPVQLDVDWGGPDTVVGALPARTELVSLWRADEGQTLPEDSTHPAVVALFDALAERRIDLRDREVRQTVIGQGEGEYAVEVAITVAER